MPRTLCRPKGVSRADWEPFVTETQQIVQKNRCEYDKKGSFRFFDAARRQPAWRSMPLWKQRVVEFIVHEQFSDNPNVWVMESLRVASSRYQPQQIANLDSREQRWRTKVADQKEFEDVLLHYQSDRTAFDTWTKDSRSQQCFTAPSAAVGGTFVGWPCPKAWRLWWILFLDGKGNDTTRLRKGNVWVGFIFFLRGNIWTWLMMLIVTPPMMIYKHGKRGKLPIHETLQIFTGYVSSPPKQHNCCSTQDWSNAYVASMLFWFKKNVFEYHDAH